MLINNNSEVQSSWGVAVAAATGLSMPNVVDFFTAFGPVLDGFIKLGQLGVVVVTIFYILKKAGAIPSGRGKQGEQGERGERGKQGKRGEQGAHE